MGERQHPVVAFVGNPNVGKSTLFNRLTGMNQHTGNWPGKTVSLAHGKYDDLILVDLPGTYSLRSRSKEEKVTEQFLLSGEADCAVVVCDASSLERNLIFAQQILQLYDKTVICVNMIDEAHKQNISVDCVLLEQLLGVPVVPTSAGSGMGIEVLMQKVQGILSGNIQGTPIRMTSDAAPDAYVKRAEKLSELTMTIKSSHYRNRREREDRLLTSGVVGIPLFTLLLLLVVYLSVTAANVPSAWLQTLFLHIEGRIRSVLPTGWLTSLLMDGIYTTVSRVISVMLPPMVVFFSLFSILEEMGLFPRLAFLMDHSLAECGGCGKQALTMCMGLGCNAVGVTGCRIIDSPRERIIAMLTNSFMPCNGRFPTLILLGILAVGGSRIGGAAAVTALILLGIPMTMLAGKLLSGTILKREKSAYILEIPPLRMPRLKDVVTRSILDRVLRVAGRAVFSAAPAGMILWLLNRYNLVPIIIWWFEPVGRFIGINGAILFAFLMALPANELMIPILLLAITGANGLNADLSGADMTELLLAYGLTWKRALCTMVFCSFHWPCATTLITVYKESGKLRYAALALIIPTVFGAVLCFLLRLLLDVI